MQNEAIVGCYTGDLTFWASPFESTVWGLIWASRGLLASQPSAPWPSWGPEEQMTQRGEGGGKELKRWEKRRGSLRWNEMLSYKAVRATHLFHTGELIFPCLWAFLLPINAGLWMKTWLYIFKSAGSQSGEERGTELGIIDVPSLIVWCVIVSRPGRSITAAISLDWACFDSSCFY